ncbi:50S ribosomal protein [Niveomyces insectorum RCEF 264]|uniref:50S ribosomal protein n=1 Tax=Niveomyces insectorum RCEF 264 TaxID=1081102 RepID=A0A167MT99_9HYPO|nr:50S ribosomal protein [Niveomyces insectorum RCEF 264]
MAAIFSEAAGRLRSASSIPFACFRREALTRMAGFSSSSSLAFVPRQKLCARSVPLPCGRRTLSTTSSCHARLVSRPQRPYHFTQIVQLSDGSTFTVRTTNPHPLHRCTKDSRNHSLWQPSEKSLRNIEVDEAGKLAAFRTRFGHGWDADEQEPDEAGDATQAKKTGGAAEAVKTPAAGGQDALDSLTDLLSGYAAKEEPLKYGGLSAKEQARKDRKKK